MSLNHGLQYFSVLVVGAAAGFVAGVLTAPASGAETRRRLSWRLDEGRSRLRRGSQRVVEETAARLEHGIEAGKHRIEQALQG